MSRVFPPTNRTEKVERRSVKYLLYYIKITEANAIVRASFHMVVWMLYKRCLYVSKKFPELYTLSWVFLPVTLSIAALCWRLTVFLLHLELLLLIRCSQRAAETSLRARVKKRVGSGANRTSVHSEAPPPLSGWSSAEKHARLRNTFLLGLGI